MGELAILFQGDILLITTQVILLGLAIGLLAQLIYQFRFRTEKPVLGYGIASLNLTFAIFALIGDETTLFPTSGPPPKFDLPNTTAVTTRAVQACIGTVPMRQSFSASVTPHSSGGYGVEIVGKDLMLSDEKSGLWERAMFFLDIEDLGPNRRIQYVGLHGSFTLSNSDETPPLGERWQPFNSQGMARYILQMDSFFTSLTSCIETLNEQRSYFGVLEKQDG